MYEQHFGLKHEPFSIAPDSRFLFMSPRHREALAHLLYGLERGGGFVLLTGEIGAGKTTVCRRFLKQIPPHVDIAYVLNPKCTVDELLSTICLEFGIPVEEDGPVPARSQDYIDALNGFLLKNHAAGRSSMLIIDEAQNLSMDVLEQLRLLTNLETDERKLLQILLIGQPELRQMLAAPELEQLAQRVIARYHLRPLTEQETEQYIRFRIKMAGGHGPLPFSRDARQRIHQLTGGVPRRINLVCDRALLGAYGAGKTRVDRGLVDSAAREVLQHRSKPLRRHQDPVLWWAGGLALAAVMLSMAAWMLSEDDAAPPSSAAKAAPVKPLPAAVVTNPAPAPSSAVPSAIAPAPAPASPAAPLGNPLAQLEPAAPAVELQPNFSSLIRSERDAWQELGSFWRLVSNGEDPCRAAERQQVFCFKSRSDLALIRQLDRPGIVTLYDQTNTPAYALLIGLSGTQATLRAGGVSRTMPLAALARIWRGDFATYWQAPAGYNGRPVEAGSPVAEQLAARLAAYDGSSPPPGRRELNAWLKAHVSAFQLAQGLKPDGTAGATTFMQLNRVSGIDEPRLQH
jgi:general secretion pathway protein A